jgi:excisionase family DNA binding protein
MLMKVCEAAKELNCSPSLVYHAIAQGRLRCHRLGNRQGAIRISQEHLQAFLQSTEQAGAPSPAKPTPRPIKLKHLEI